MARTRLSVCEVPDLTVDERVQIGRLSRRGGMLGERLSRLLRKKREGKELPSNCIILARQKNKIVAWAMLCHYRSATDLMMYVQKAYRSQGIGTLLGKTAKELHHQRNMWSPLCVYLMKDQNGFYRKLRFVSAEDYKGSLDAKKCVTR